MHVKYQITMEVEVEVDKDEAEETTRRNLLYWAKRGLKNEAIKTTEAEAVKTGATGVTPKDTKNADEPTDNEIEEALIDQGDA